MSTPLRLAALMVAVGTIAFWFLGGLNLGWTRWQGAAAQFSDAGRSSMQESQFLPGLDFVAGGLLVAAVLAVASAEIRNRSRLFLSNGAHS